MSLIFSASSGVVPRAGVDMPGSRAFALDAVVLRGRAGGISTGPAVVFEDLSAIELMVTSAICQESESEKFSDV